MNRTPSSSNGRQPLSAHGQCRTARNADATDTFFRRILQITDMNRTPRRSGVQHWKMSATLRDGGDARDNLHNKYMPSKEDT